MGEIVYVLLLGELWVTDMAVLTQQFIVIYNSAISHTLTEHNTSKHMSGVEAIKGYDRHYDTKKCVLRRTSSLFRDEQVKKVATTPVS